MDFGKTLSSPIVLAGGAALGLILLLTRGNSSSAAAASTTTSGPSPAFLSATVQSNRDAGAAQVSLAGINAGIQVAGISAATQREAYAYSFLDSQARTSASLQAQTVASTAGIVNTEITTSSAQRIDAMNNQSRLDLAGVTARTTVQVAQIDADVKKRASIISAISGVIGTVAQVGLAAATGGVSLAPGIGTIFGGGSNGMGSVAGQGMSMADFSALDTGPRVKI